VITEGPIVGESTGSLQDPLSKARLAVRIPEALLNFGPPLLVGIVAAWLIVGTGGVDPTNIGWNSVGDAATHYLGWLFFRHSPWTIPLGLNPNYGLELGSSIFYSDSIPLLAFLFKPFSPWLPQHFQYQGLWTALCLVLQSCFAWGLLGRNEVTRGRVLRLFAVTLFVFSPPMMIRIVGHSALVAHWAILAALYLYFRRDKGGFCPGWPVLTFVVSLVHSYLLVMVFAIWFADLVSRRPMFRQSAKQIALEVGSVAGLALLALWQAGFFVIQAAGSAGGYGEYGMNLLALITPDIYSHILKGVSSDLNGFKEGFNFLGLGCLILIPALLPAVIKEPRLLRVSSRQAPLAVILALLMLFSISNVIHLGVATFTVPLPDWVVQKANILRASGRMFWPVFYVLIAWMITALAKVYGQRVATGVLAIACLFQVVDTSEPWIKLRDLFANRSASWSTPLRATFWDAAGTTYSKLRIVPLVHHVSDYATWAYYAGSHGMATDATYLARVDPAASEKAAAAAERAVESGIFDADSLYVMDKRHAARAIITKAPSDVLVEADGFYALAPGWRKLENVPNVPVSELGLRDIKPGVLIGHEYFMGAGGDGVEYLSTGWSLPESWGVWSERGRAVATFPVDARQELPKQVAVHIGALVSQSHPRQDIECRINGVLAKAFSFDSTSALRWEDISVPDEAIAEIESDQQLKIEFRILNPANPKKLGLSEDTRDLGVAVHHVRLSSI
jgi:hypothetical protein